MEALYLLTIPTFPVLSVYKQLLYINNHHLSQFFPIPHSSVLEKVA
jgi:hypothetical protein